MEEEDATSSEQSAATVAVNNSKTLSAPKLYCTLLKGLTKCKLSEKQHNFCSDTGTAESRVVKFVTLKSEHIIKRRQLRETKRSSAVSRTA